MEHINSNQCLEEEIVDINKRDKWGMTPLLTACDEGNANQINKLLLTGANINNVNDNGDECLSLAFGNQHTTTLDSNQIEIILILLKHRANSNALCSTFLSLCSPDKDDPNRSQSCLQFACEHGYEIVVRALLKNGANMHQEHYGCTCAYYAMIYMWKTGDDCIIKLLLESGYDINHKNNEGNTLILDFCAGCLSEYYLKYHKWEYMNPLKFLVKNHADVFATTPEHNCITIGFIENPPGIDAIEYLRNLSVEINYKKMNWVDYVFNDFSISHEKTYEYIKYFLSLYSDNEQKKLQANMCLKQAFIWGFCDTIKLLAENGADIYMQFNGKSGWVLGCDNLHDGWDCQSMSIYMCNDSCIELMKLMMELKYDINHVDSDGNSCMIHMLKTGYMRKSDLEFFVKNGADLNIVNKNGKGFLSILCNMYTKNKYCDREMLCEGAFYREPTKYNDYHVRRNTSDIIELTEYTLQHCMEYTKTEFGLEKIQKFLGTIG